MQEVLDRATSCCERFESFNGTQIGQLRGGGNLGAVLFVVYRQT